MPAPRASRRQKPAVSDPAPVPESTPEPPAASLGEQCQALMAQIAALGVHVQYGGVFDLANIKPAIDASAAAALMIAKGICTREEWEDATLTILREVLNVTLKQAEQQKEQAARPQIAIVRPGSMHNVGRHKH